MKALYVHSALRFLSSLVLSVPAGSRKYETNIVRSFADQPL